MAGGIDAYSSSGSGICSNELRHCMWLAMCAPQVVSMDSADIKKRHMYSLGDAKSHHFASTVAINDSNSVLQTEDRRQWVAIDLLPKNIRDSLADPHDGLAQRDGDAMGNRGASKVMAWVRQSKRGFDVRILRRKPKSGRDEYTDLSVERDFTYETPETGRKVFEMHADSIIHEICDTEPRHELSAAPPRYSAAPDCNSSSQFKKSSNEPPGISTASGSPATKSTGTPLVRLQLARRMSFEPGKDDTLQTDLAQEDTSRPKLHVQTGSLPSATPRSIPVVLPFQEFANTAAAGTAQDHSRVALAKETVHEGEVPMVTAHVKGQQLAAPKSAANLINRKARPNSVHGSDSGYHSEPGSSYAESDFDSLSSNRQTAHPALSGLKTVDEVLESPKNDDVPGSPDEEIPQSTKSMESMELIIKLALAKLLQEQAPAATTGVTSDADVNHELREHKIAEATRFETDTDADPPSPSDRKVPRVQIRHKIGLRPYQRRRGTAGNKPAERRQFEETDTDSSALEKRLTMARTVDASAGPEEAWKALLSSQKLILGPEHTLVLKSKLKRNESRDQDYNGCANGLLQPLHETEAIATSFFGKSHPKVMAFSANLKALEALLRSQDPVSIASEQEPAVRPEHSSETCASSPVLEKVASGISITLPEDASVASQVKQSPTQLDSATDSSKLLIPPGFRAATGDSPVSPIDPRTLFTAENIWNSDRPPHAPKNDLLVLSGLALEAMTKVSLNFMLWLRSTYGPEPEVEPGKVRVRWTCSCGQHLYDDFVENRTGAARELERYLNRPRSHASHNPSSPTTPSSYQPSQNSSFGMPPSSQSSLNSVTPPQQSHHPGLYGRSPTLGSLPGYSPYNAANYEAKFLLTCANEDRFTPKVTHLNVQPNVVLNDRHLAQKLREHYAYVNRQWWKRLMKLRGLATIEFVQFEIHKNRFADIRKCPDMPDRGTKDYTFEPDDLLPPVGSTYLLHLFQHPEDYEHENLTYLRVPKKNGPLDTGKGWGINLCEGFPAERVLVFLLIGFSLASLVFAIAWFCKAKHDIQGAFSVAQWICTIGALCFAWVQSLMG